MKVAGLAVRGNAQQIVNVHHGLSLPNKGRFMKLTRQTPACNATEVLWLMGKYSMTNRGMGQLSFDSNYLWYLY
jgi:hypothetical protein